MLQAKYQLDQWAYIMVDKFKSKNNVNQSAEEYFMNDENACVKMTTKAFEYFKNKRQQETGSLVRQSNQDTTNADINEMLLQVLLGLDAMCGAKLVLQPEVIIS